MRKIFLLTLVLGLGLSAVQSRPAVPSTQDTQATPADTQVVTVQVDGLACPFCAYGLEKKLKRLPGVEKLEIRINTGEVVLWFSRNSTPDFEAIVKKVKEAGFTPRKISVNGSEVFSVEKKVDESTTSHDH